MTDRDIQAWLETGRAILAESCGLQLGQVRVIVGYKISGDGIDWTLPPADRPGGRVSNRWTTLVEQPAGEVQPPPRVTLAEKDTLQAIGNDTLPMKQIAKRLDTTHRSALKTRLAKLRRDGLLGHQGLGYFVTPMGRAALTRASEVSAESVTRGQVEQGQCPGVQSGHDEDGSEPERDRDHERSAAGQQPTR